MEGQVGRYLSAQYIACVVRLCRGGVCDILGQGLQTLSFGACPLLKGHTFATSASRHLAQMLSLPGSPCWLLQLLRDSTDYVIDLALDQLVPMSDSVVCLPSNRPLTRLLTQLFMLLLVHLPCTYSASTTCATCWTYNGGERTHSCAKGLTIYQRRARNNGQLSTQTCLNSSRIPAVLLPRIRPPPQPGFVTIIVTLHVLYSYGLDVLPPIHIAYGLL